MSKIKDCDHYPCWDYRVLGWNTPKKTLRRHHANHNVALMGETVAKGLHLRRIPDALSSLVHNGKKARKS